MKPRRGRRRVSARALLWRALGRLALPLMLGVVVVGTYNGLIMGFARKYDDGQQRNRRTGVLQGAQQLDLGPQDAKIGVILVHGFLGAQNNFGGLPKRLATAGYRVRALRLPGHGTTPFDLERTHSVDMLNYVAAQAREMKADHEQIFLVGHSMGSTLSLLVATYADVDGVVLGAPHFKVTHFWWYGLPVETSNLLTSWAVRWVYKSDAFIRVRRPEAKLEILSYRYVPTRSARELDKLAVRARDPETLVMLTCPILLLHGAHDSASSPQVARAAFDRMAADDKTFMLLENSDHHIYMDYDREQVFEAIVDWIAAHS